MMTRALANVAAQALELPSSDRAALAHRLIVSLDDGPDEDPTEVELAWEAEIQQRLSEYRRGETQAVPSSEVFAKARCGVRRSYGSGGNRGDAAVVDEAEDHSHGGRRARR
jgi:putative addiction module component (TIGR02574 family)